MPTPGTSTKLPDDGKGGVGATADDVRTSIVRGTGGVLAATAVTRTEGAPGTGGVGEAANPAHRSGERGRCKLGDSAGTRASGLGPAASAASAGSIGAEADAAKRRARGGPDDDGAECPAATTGGEGTATAGTADVIAVACATAGAMAENAAEFGATTGVAKRAAQ
mmetsp:Transcript_118915/g.341646  ORF Transcript_118915/g.341646 Transcript_118915/m.341646 type:complete len:166 (+) Transcript_118915:331-828(+)